MKYNIKIFFRTYRFKFLILFLASSVFVPNLAIFLLLLTGLFGATIILLQLAATYSRINSAATVSQEKPLSSERFVSIHLACHNEPPKIVIETLRALADLNYKNFEVLVIDNNTTDAKLWQPVQEQCRKLGEKFRFFHVEKLKGFKSGALNLALKYMNPRAEVLMLIDADYVVDKDLLMESNRYFDDPTVALVQYPQDYLNITPDNIGIGLEYQSFFSALMKKANTLNAVTVTGTMGLLRAKLFQNDLRWNEWCITEDTELGIHLHRLGYRGVYINESRGRGLMPLDYYSLRRQRQRWAFGNMQVILKDLISILTNRDLNWLQKRSFLTQLTTWFHPNLLPIITLCSAFLVASYAVTPELVVVISLSLAILVLFWLAKATYFFRILYTSGLFSWRKLILTLLAHYGLSSVMSTAWIQALLGIPLSYNRTNKDPEEAAPQPIPGEIIGAITLLISGLIALVTVPLVIVKALALLAISFAIFLLLAVASLLYQLKVTQKITKEIVRSW